MLETLKILWSFSVAQGCCCKLTVQTLQLIDISTNWKTLFTVCNFYTWKTFSMFTIKKFWDQHGTVDNRSHFACLSEILSTDMWWEHSLEMVIKMLLGDHVLRTHSVLNLPQLRDRESILEEGFNC